MKQDIQKISSLAMLAPDKEEAERLAQDIEQIFALTAELADALPSPEIMSDAVTCEQLRFDTASEADTERRYIRISQNEKEGFVRVARTVG